MKERRPGGGGGTGRRERPPRGDGKPSWARRDRPEAGPGRGGRRGGGAGASNRPGSQRDDHHAPGRRPDRDGSPGSEEAPGEDGIPPRQTRADGRLLYGINPITEALAAGRKVHEAWALSSGSAAKSLIGQLRARGVPVHAEDRHQLSQRCGSVQHQGLVARVGSLPNGSLSGLVKDRPEADLTVLVLDHLQDPQNLGAIYRSADAFGVDLIFIPATEAASPQLASVAKASAGAVEHVRTIVVRDLAKAVSELKGHGFRLVGLASPDTGVAATADLGAALTAGRLAIALGAEGAGLSKTVRSMCDELVSIGTTGKVGSLNAGTACGVVLHQRFLRSR